MENTIFHPKGGGYIIAMAMLIIFVLLCVVMIIFGITEDNIRLIIIPIPIIILLSSAAINLIKYTIKITEEYITAPKVYSALKPKKENILFSFKRYSNNAEKVFFKDILKTDIDYKYIYRTSYIYLVFICKDGDIKKIDLKLFNKKQAKNILAIVQQKLNE